MAKDVVTRLRLESGEFDNRIKRATAGLMQLEQECRNSGKSLATLTNDQKQYVQSLGQMQTVSNTVRGKLGELTQAYTELSVQYKRLADDEKKGDYGKALSASLDQLKARIGETKAQLNDVSVELGNTKNASNETGSVLDNLAGKFGLNIKQLTGIGAALATAKAALEVAKDAFGANEAAVDEWGRIVDSSRSLYEGFLNSINTGDISGFLSRIDQIVQAARTAYDELDRLGTMKTIQAPQISAQQTENDRLRMMIQTRRYIAPVDGRRSAMQNGQLLTPAQIKRLEQQLQNGLQKVTSLVGNEVKQTSRAIDAVYRRQGAELGMSVKEFRKGTSSMAEFDKRIEGAANYQKWQREHSYVDQQSGRLITPRTGNPYQQYKGWDVFRVDGERYNKLVQLIQQRDQQSAQAYSTQSQAYRTINRAEGISARGTSTTPKTTNKNTGAHTTIEKTEMQLNSEQIKRLTEEYITASEERRAAIQAEIKTLQERNKEIQGLMDEAQGKIKPTQKLTAEQTTNIARGNLTGNDYMKAGAVEVLGTVQALNKEMERLTALRDKATTPEEWQRLNEAIKGVEVQRSNFTGEKRGKEEKSEFDEGYDKMQKSFAGLTSVLGGLQQIGLKMPESVERGIQIIQGLMSIIQGVQTVIQVFSTGSQTANTVAVTANTAAATAKTATMAALITALQINTATGMIPFFAGGGVAHAARGMRVPGNYMSGDQVPAMLNSGEVVLNRAQTGNIASQLAEGGQAGYTPSHVSGEQIYIAMNRYLKRSGKGEIVTWRQ